MLVGQSDVSFPRQKNEVKPMFSKKSNLLRTLLLNADDDLYLSPWKCGENHPLAEKVLQ